MKRHSRDLLIEIRKAARKPSSVIKKYLLCATFLSLPLMAAANEDPCDGYTFTRKTADQSKTFWVNSSDGTIKACIAEYGIDALSDDGSHPLNLAAYYRKTPSIVAHLIQSGAEVDHRDKRGKTPLMEAAFGSGSSQTLALLIDAGADVNATSKTGDTPLTIAIRHNDSSADIRVLIAAGADLEVVKPNKRTPLFMSVRSAGPNITKMLIEAGAELDARDNEGQTPLHWALSLHKPQQALVLLRAGADPNQAASSYQSIARSVTQSYINKKLPLSVVKAAVDAGMRFDQPENEILVMDMALDYYLETGDRRLLDLFLQAGQDIDHTQEPPLFDFIIQKASLSTIRGLLTAGADMNRTDDAGFPALYLAIAYSRADIVNLLLNRGAATDVNPNTDLDPFDYFKDRYGVDFRSSPEMDQVMERLKQLQ